MPRNLTVAGIANTQAVFVQDDVTANTSRILDTAESFLYYVNKEKDMQPNMVTRRSRI